MRCLYREKIYRCGDYLEVDIFPVYSQSGRGRKRRAKPTSEVQARLNQHHAERALCRILNANFTKEDIEIALTYRRDELPATYEEAYRDAQNYLRRCKRLRARLGLSELKYVLVPGGGRFHFHVVMNGGIDRSTLEELWGRGYANSRRLQFNENGIEGLAKYIGRQVEDHTAARFEREKGRKRFSCSRNIKKPEPQERDGRISHKRVEELATFDAGSRGEFEKLYPGYYFSNSAPFYNEVNGGYYLCVQMYRKDAGFTRVKRRRQEAMKE